MRAIIVGLLVVFGLFGVASANVMKAYNGNIPFDHKTHRSMFKCADCHEGSPRYFELNKQTGHKLCIGCHKKEGAGPSVNCSGCHKQDLLDNG